MKLTVFFAADGDCLLLSSGDGHHVLVDGGRKGTFEAHAQPVLQELAARDEALDLVVVSHIDADHISGVISLLSDLADWTVHDFQVGDGGNPTFPAPARPRPPRIAQVWHNSWRAQLGDLAGPVEALAGTVAEAVELVSPGRAASSRAARRALESLAGLAESIPDGITLLQLVDDRTPVPRNRSFGGKLALLRQPVHTEQVGTTTLSVLGPSEQHLRRLRDEWKEWLRRQRPPGPGGGPAGAPGLALLARPVDGGPTSVEDARSVIASIATAAEVIEKADSARVTPPNRASITLLAEEDGRTCLLTGDAAEEELLDGLAAAGRLSDGPFRCDVLKVQHHGSEFNLSRVFARQVLATHYVFSADGAHGNPDPSVIATIVESRRAADGPFTLCFTCSESRTRPERRRAMAAAIREARDAAARHPGVITVEVLDDRLPFLEIEV